MLGEAAGAGGKPGMTGTLTLRYRRGTPLGDLRAEAHIDRVEGIKTYAVGHLADAEGVTVEAEGVFILPRWAREASRAQPSDPRAASSEPAVRTPAHRLGRPVTPRSPASVSRASSAACASSSARRVVSSIARAASYAPGSETRSAAPRLSRASALRAKICCSVVVRSERPRPRNETTSAAAR